MSKTGAQNSLPFLLLSLVKTPSGTSSATFIYMFAAHEAIFFLFFSFLFFFFFCCEQCVALFTFLKSTIVILAART